MAMPNPQDMVEEDAADLQFPKGEMRTAFAFRVLFTSRHAGRHARSILNILPDPYPTSLLIPTNHFRVRERRDPPNQ